MGVIKKILFRWKKDTALVKTLSLSTTSNSATWSPDIIINNGSTLTWKATGGVTQTIVADDPTFNLSSNVGTVNMDVYNVSLLNKFDVANLNITSIDVTQATVLDFLYSGFNPITTLDVTQNTLLTKLNCTDNSLTTLDISQNTILNTIFCDNNSLTTLNTSTNTLLEFLICTVNSLTSLNVSNNTLLKTIWCRDNSLATLDISANTLVNNLSCYGNSFSSTVTNSILASLVSHGVTGGQLLYRNNETGQGVTDRATLVTRGWTIVNYAT